MKIDTLDEYERALEVFASRYILQDDGAFEMFVVSLMDDVEAEACLDFRGRLATDSELDEAGPKLQMGFFHQAPADRQLLWWLFYDDLAALEVRLRYRRLCAPYEKTQPLFAGSPSLFGRIRRRIDKSGEQGSFDFELIDDRVLQPVDDSEVMRLPRGFGKLSFPLRPDITAWARSEFPNAPRYLRLNPSFWSKDQPLQLLEEAAVAPANPAWLQTLALFPGESTYAQYVLEQCDVSANQQHFWDYNVLNIRRLEAVTTRRESDYLSMLIEELPKPDDKSRVMVARCIHLDTRAPRGTPMAEAKLQHLDLAINVYEGADRDARITDTLQFGKVQDATYRTHLFRIEDVPFPVMLSFAEAFLQSKVLFEEWTADLLRNMPED